MEYYREGKKIHVRFDGYLYTAWPDAKNSGQRYLARRVWDKERKCVGTCVFLHRAVWEKANGSIPEGYDIHHKDHNIYNNELSNLELVLKEEHHKMHLKEAHDVPLEELKRRAAKAKANTWEKHVCKQCGKEFYGHSTYGWFCSSSCYDKYRTKTCVCCGKPFIYSHKRQQCCSIDCKHEYFGRQKTITKPCTWCGKLTEGKYLNIKMGSSVFCSSECRRQHRNKINRECYHRKMARLREEKESITNGS